MKRVIGTTTKDKYVLKVVIDTYQLMKDVE